MQRHEFSILRATSGIAAAAMTALTLALAIVVPVELASAPHGSAVATERSTSIDTDRSAAAATERSATSVATEVDIIPSRIEVLGARQTTAFVPVRANVAKRKQST